MKKGILILILTFLFMGMLTEKVSAQTLSESGESTSVPVVYTVDNTAFIITIPAVITADFTETTFEVGAEYVNLRPDEYLEVKITSGSDQDGVVTLQRQNVPEGKDIATLKTTLSVEGSNIGENNNVVGFFQDSSDSQKNLKGKVALSPLEINEETESGDYLAILQFTVELGKEYNE